MPESRDPLSYREIKKIVLERIRNRTWAADSLLPSEEELAAEFSSTRTTVNRALRELAEDGYLERKRRAGTRVLEVPIRKAQFAIPLVRDEIAKTGATYRYALVDRTQTAAPAWLSARLNLKPGQTVLHIRCMHYAGNAAFQFEDRWIVFATVPDILQADFSGSGPNDWLVKNVPFTNLELSFMATKADQAISEFLDMAPGDPVFTAERITWLNGATVTFAKLYFAQGYRMKTTI